MATDYGTDIAAADDLPDPEVLVSGDLNMAYAEARRLLTQDGALEEIGDTEPYDSLDIRQYLGDSAEQAELDDLQNQASQVLVADERVLSMDVDLQFGNNSLRLTGQGIGTEGPFQLVMDINSVSATVLRGT